MVCRYGLPRLHEIAIMRILNADAAAFSPFSAVFPAAFAKNPALMQYKCKRGSNDVAPI